MSNDSTAQFIRRSALALIAGPLFTVGVHAATIEATASATNVGLAATNNFSDGPAVAGFVDVLDFDNIGSVNYGIHTYGDVTGHYGSRTSGSGAAGDSYDVQGRFTFSEMFVNTSAVTQNLTVSVSTLPGEVSVDTLVAGSAVLEARYNLSMSADGSTVLDSNYEIINNGGVHTQTSSGLDIAAATPSISDGLNGAGNSYTFDAHSFLVDLGPVAGGASVLFELDLFTQANGIIGDDAECLGGDGRGDELFDHNPTDGPFGGCGSIARFGDPLFPAPTTGGTGSQITAHFRPVPAPTTFALFGIGLLALAGIRRRRG